MAKKPSTTSRASQASAHCDLPTELPIRIELPSVRSSAHPFFVFWLGFLTGVLALSLGIGYLLLQTQALQEVITESAVL